MAKVQNTLQTINQNLQLPVDLDGISLPQELPPIVLIAFTRPDLLKQVLPAIAQQTLRPRQILAFVDGPRNANDKLLIEECINLLTEFSDTVPVKIINQPHNLGCDVNAISALTEALSHYPAVVYLEDDVVPNPYFYDRMCRMLEAYREIPQVFSVTAYANFPSEVRQLISDDFMVSKRVFALGWGTWADRWQDLDLSNYKQGYNPFGKFYDIPATIQTKYTIVNQFFIEKEKKQDWVITLTLAALYKGYVHITPMASFIHNIGFGHPQAKTYSAGGEPAWANAHSDSSACLKRLPPSLDLINILAAPLDGVELARHLESCGGIWLSPSDTWQLLRKYNGWQSRIAFLKLFFSRVRILVRRWLAGRPV
ncbi:MAG: sugar transferase [Mojavia pulchra JT2-VF2]|jgi:glycosyltransferase involved in cell wall biosynthesis|uniref:Sugar transferase n=1 Tax=Mojavia pulchra JT2-VF2 TaxID=287848 RepID=A0A951Q3J6_9NOST|nr:sugar transferase [Mojavia pulchra JT2-VF2]